MNLEGMIFVVTGGASGIGAATAAVAAESGAKVVIASRSADRGNDVVREIADGGGQAIFQRCDVAVEEDVRTLMRTAADTYGRSEEHTSELQSHSEVVCRLLLE